MMKFTYPPARMIGISSVTSAGTLNLVRADTQQDFWLNTTQARDYGLVGRVIASASELS